MTADMPSGWPPGVEPISIEDPVRLGSNRRPELIWDGRHVEICWRLISTGFQKFIAFVVTFCAIPGCPGGFVTGFNNVSVLLCARHISLLTRPLPWACRRFRTRRNQAILLPPMEDRCAGPQAAKRSNGHAIDPPGRAASMIPTGL